MLLRELEHKEQAMHADTREKCFQANLRQGGSCYPASLRGLLGVLRKPRSSKQSDQLVAVLPGG